MSATATTTGIRVRTVAAGALLALAALLSACDRSGESGAGDDPVAAVKYFLVDGVVDHNGFEACQYLTPREKRAASRRAGGGQCRQAFDLAQLIFGGHQIQTVRQVRRLSGRAVVNGDRAHVRLKRGDMRVEFGLVRADFAEEEEFQPPDTEWRIAAGALAVIPPAGSAASRAHRPAVGDSQSRAEDRSHDGLIARAYVRPQRTTKTNRRLP